MMDSVLYSKTPFSYHHNQVLKRKATKLKIISILLMSSSRTPFHSYPQGFIPLIPSSPFWSHFRVWKLKKGWLTGDIARPQREDAVFYSAGSKAGPTEALTETNQASCTTHFQMLVLTMYNTQNPLNV